MRSYQITPTRISYYTLSPYRNHTSLLKKKYIASHICKSDWVKKFRARMWVWFGVAI